MQSASTRLHPGSWQTMRRKVITIRVDAVLDFRADLCNL